MSWLNCICLALWRCGFVDLDVHNLPVNACCVNSGQPDRPLKVRRCWGKSKPRADGDRGRSGQNRRIVVTPSYLGFGVARSTQPAALFVQCRACHQRRKKGASECVSNGNVRRSERGRLWQVRAIRHNGPSGVWLSQCRAHDHALGRPARLCRKMRRKFRL